MFEVKAEAQQQQLKLIVRNVYDEEDFKTILFLLNREIIKLNSGWTAAIDLRGMRAQDERLLSYIKKIQKLFLDHNVMRIVTLVDNVFLKMQLMLTARESGSDKITSRFTNKKEWEAFLATSKIINKSQTDKPDRDKF